jgi:hypothetical protein
MTQNWGRVYQMAFIWHLQLLNPEIWSLLLDVARRANE